MPDRLTSRKGWRCDFPLVRTTFPPSAPSSTGRNNGRRRRRYSGRTYAIRTPRKGAMPSPQTFPRMSQGRRDGSHDQFPSRAPDAERQAPLHRPSDSRHAAAGDAWDETQGQRQGTLGVLAPPQPPLGSRRREGVSAQSPAGRGTGGNPPTCTAQTHAARSCGLSLHPEEAERQKAPLSRPRAGSEGDGRGEGRGGRPVETIQTEPSQGDIHPRRPQGFLHTLEGQSGRSGGAGAQSLAGVRRPLPMQMGQGSGEGRSERTGRPAWSGAGRTRHPRQRYKDARRGSRYAG